MTNLRDKLIPVSFLATIGIAILSFQLPRLRFWGLDAWITFPIFISLSVLSIIAIIYLLMVKWNYLDLLFNSFNENVKTSNQNVFFFILFVLFGASFILFPAESYFLGDGRQLLDYMANGKSAAKAWDIGATHFVNLILDLSGGRSEANALMAYRSMSIASGIVCLIAVLTMSRLIFNNSYKAILFSLGILSSGQALLFFGYIENYAPMISIMTIICLYAILVAQGKARLWLLLPLLAIATYIHLFGLVLLPALIYLVVRDYKFVKSLSMLSWTKTLSLFTILTVCLMVAYVIARQQSLFWKFNLIPLLPDQFTIDGETLFSVKHLLDTFNLLLLLVPGILIALIVKLKVKRSIWFDHPDKNFLLIASLSCIGAAFLLNAQLGLPRDWDLFAFVGVPLSIYLYYSILSHSKINRNEITSIVLMVLLGFGFLIPRVSVEQEKTRAVVHFKNYLDLDISKGRNGRTVMIEYYYHAGDTLATNFETVRFAELHPEVGYNYLAQELIKKNDFANAALYSQEAILSNPRYSPAYHNLGGCFRSVGQYDSALYYLNIADALNSNSSATVAMIGGVYLKKGELSKSRMLFERAYRINNENSDAILGIIYFNLIDGYPDRAIAHVRRLKNKPETTGLFFQDAGNAFLSQRAYQLAIESFEIAISRGLDSMYLQQLQSKYPQLR